MAHKRPPNSKMYFERAFRKARLTGTLGFVGYYLATHDNGDGKGFFKSYDNLAQDIGVHPRSARRLIKDLENARWIRRTRTGRKGSGASEFELTIPAERLDEVLRPDEASDVRSRFPRMLAPRPGESGPANRTTEVSQPDSSSAQQGATALPVDHPYVRPVSVELSEDDSSSRSFRVEDYLKGDLVPREFFDRLCQEDQTHFFPTFDDTDRMEFVG